jgi:D-alanyl-lipoteichoic acid acyltransferase DltB (MBOAT superfamily)
MIVSGLWHGAGLTFLIWGLIHAIGTMISHIFTDIRKMVIKKSSRFLSSIRLFIGWILTTLLVTFAWIYFNADSISTANSFINGIFTNTAIQNRFVNISIIAVISLVFLSNLLQGKIGLIFENFLNKIPKFIAYLLIIILVLLALGLGPETVPPFIYFNF